MVSNLIASVCQSAILMHCPIREALIYHMHAYSPTICTHTHLPYACILTYHTHACLFRAALTYQIASWLHLCGLTSERTAGPERGFSQNCTTSVIELMRNVEKNALEQYKRDLRVSCSEIAPDGLSNGLADVGWPLSRDMQVKGAASQAPNRIQELQEAQARLADRLRIDHEHTTNRFDRIESSVNQIADLVKALSDDLRSSAVPSAAPSRLHGGANGGTNGGYGGENEKAETKRSPRRSPRAVLRKGGASTPVGQGPSMHAGSGSFEAPSEEMAELTAEITPVHAGSGSFEAISEEMAELTAEITPELMAEITRELTVEIVASLCVDPNSMTQQPLLKTTSRPASPQMSTSPEMSLTSLTSPEMPLTSPEMSSPPPSSLPPTSQPPLPLPSCGNPALATTADAPRDHSPPTRDVAATSHPGRSDARSARRSTGVRRLARLEAPIMARSAPSTPRTTSNGSVAADKGAISRAISQEPGTQQKLGPAVLGTCIRI